MKDGYLFFCQHCGVPQEITEYIIKHYLANKNVEGVYCTNCNCLNPISLEDRVELFKKL